jgi:hypothetical protein
MFSFISKKFSDKKFCTWDIICDKFPNFHLNIFGLDNFTPLIQRLNRRAKSLGSHQNKSAQIQLAKLSKQIFVKLKNLSDKKNRSCYFTFE